MKPETRRLDEPLRGAVRTILREMDSFDRLVVGFSGGVDSSTVAALAHRALGDHAVAATVRGETLSRRELDEARQTAEYIGIQHRIVELSELGDDRFRENTPARCYFCQNMRFGVIEKLAEHLDCDVVAAGTNASDPGEHRPGLQAMKERQIYQPLLDHGVEKTGVRRIARWLGLPVWDKPTEACLASRVPHGDAVTEEKLRRVEEAEDVLRERGYEQVRVRLHDDFVRIEVGTGEVARLLQPQELDAVASRLSDLELGTITVDLGGYQSGSVSPTSDRAASDHE